MTDKLFEDDDDANTPLTGEEREQIIPSYITMRHELNEAEQVNIGQALRWVTIRKRDILDQEFLNQLHKRMFGDVGRWAGHYRATPRNVGVDAYRIPMDLLRSKKRVTVDLEARRCPGSRRSSCDRGTKRRGILRWA